MKKFELPTIEILELKFEEIITCSNGSFEPGPKPPVDVPEDFWD